MAKTAQNIFVPVDLPGQVLQSTDETGLTADNKRIFKASNGTFYRDFGSQTYKTSIAEIRSFGGTGKQVGNPNIQYITNDYNCPGSFVIDTTDATSVDDGATVLVDAAGNRYKRKFDGALNAKWFGVATGSWQSDNLQNALNRAHDLGVDCYVEHDQTILLNKTVYIPENTTLRLGTNTLIRGYTPTMFNIKDGGVIRGGIIFLGSDAGSNIAAGVGVFFWGGYNYTQGQRKTGIYGTEIRGTWKAGQKGVRFAVGTDEAGNETGSNDGQSIAFVTVDAKINNCEYGISSEILGTGNGYINGLRINGFITAVKNYISGSSWTIDAQIQTQSETSRPGFDSYYAYKLDKGAGNHFIFGRIWDWTPTENNPYAIIINNFNNTIFSNIGTFSNNADRFILNNGHNNTTSFYNSYGITPPSAYINSRDTGTQDDWFFFADKKYNVTCTSGDDVTNVFRQNILVGVSITNPSTEQSITIETKDSNPITLYPRFIGITMSQSDYAEKMKIEYKDDSDVWHLIFNNDNNSSYDIIANNFKGFGYDRVFAVRFTFSSPVRNTLNIKRIWFYGIGTPNAYMPCGGGTFYGDVNIPLKNASQLGTDANGRLISIEISKSKPIRVVTGDTTITTDDCTVICDAHPASAGDPISWTLPDPTTCEGQPFKLVNWNDTNGGDITLSEAVYEGSLTNTNTLAIGNQYEIQSDGTKYWLINSN